MPASVKTKKNEERWDRAKEIAKDRGLSPNGKKANSFWAYTQAVFQRMKGNKNESTILEAAKDGVDQRVIAYHSTTQDKSIKSFRQYTHFGTKKSAKHRLADKTKKRVTGFLYKVAIKGAFYRTTDSCANDQAHMHRELSGRFGAQYKAWSEKNWINTNPWDFLLEKGYDALVYRNEVEDEGSDSYVILRPENIEILDVEEVKTSGYRRRKDLSNADKLKLMEI